ncbi:hypothetical protein [Paenibacillus sp. NPDC058174]|uniref:hypothetical protein n=1 Tax=Paenibacillus sp. NPDC058174 TaxID=3346366 RepID=UPI0036DCB6BF
MASQLNHLHELTMRIAQNIDMADVDELLELVECRDHVINSLQSISLSEDERTLLVEINKYDSLITSRMTILMEEAAQGLEKIAKTKLQKQSYEKMYAGESYFFDKKE